MEEKLKDGEKDFHGERLIDWRKAGQMCNVNFRLHHSLQKLWHIQIEVLDLR